MRPKLATILDHMRDTGHPCLADPDAIGFAPTASHARRRRPGAIRTGSLSWRGRDLPFGRINWEEWEEIMTAIWADYRARRGEAFRVY